jgi:hypothetical protein
MSNYVSQLKKEVFKMFSVPVKICVKKLFLKKTYFCKNVSHKLNQHHRIYRKAFLGRIISKSK